MLVDKHVVRTEFTMKIDDTVQSDRTEPIFSDDLAAPITRVSSTLVLKVADSSETSVNLCQTTRRHVTEDSYLRMSVCPYKLIHKKRARRI